MTEIKQLLGGEAKGTEVRINATVYDWFLMQNRTGWAICVIYGRDVKMRLLGDLSRVFKPGFPVVVYVSEA